MKVLRTPSIASCVNGEVCEFISGTTRAFRLHNDAPSADDVAKHNFPLALAAQAT